jgi:hypothetical protein
MLNAVPNALRTAARAQVMRHPNAFEAEIQRRQVTRSFGAESGIAGGLPTLGGIAVMDGEDEAEVAYRVLGSAHVLFTSAYEGTTIADRGDAAEPTEVVMAMIEPDVLGAFDVKDGDLVMLMPGAGVVITYEVTNVINAVNIPPYVPKYELSVQGDLGFNAASARD